MSLFAAVKEKVTAEDAARRYGIRIGRNGFARCIFHNDKNPSMKVDKRFHCFSCQTDGDAVDLTAKLFGLTPKQAAMKLAEDFGIAYDIPKGKTASMRPVKRQDKPRLSEQLQKKQQEAEFIGTYLDYNRLLERWQTEYRPRAPDEEWKPEFLEAVQRHSYIEGVLDMLLCGSIEDREAYIRTHGKEVGLIREKVQEYKTGRGKEKAKDQKIPGAGER